MKKRMSLLLIMIMIISTFAISGCTSGKADDKFMIALAKGLEARWELTDKADNNKDAVDTKADWEGFFNAEYDQIKSYKDAEFEDADLGKWAKTYINSIEESIDCLQYFGSNQWDTKYYNGAYQKRVEALYKINSIRKIEVSEESEGSLTELITNGEVSNMASKLLKSVKFEKTEEEYGWKTYQAVCENTSSANFDYFSFSVGLIDKDGVTLTTEEAMVNKWSSGEKVRFEFSTDEEFEKMELKYASWNF